MELSKVEKIINSIHKLIDNGNPPDLESYNSDVRYLAFVISSVKSEDYDSIQKMLFGELGCLSKQGFGSYVNNLSLLNQLVIELYDELANIYLEHRLRTKSP